MRRKKILIVEDDLSISKFLAYRLRKLDYDVIVAADGNEGLKKARLEPPDLVILDLMLPACSGEEVCKAIREDDNDQFSKTPIIMLTAKSSDVDRVIGKAIGANHYMTKPFDADELLDAVRRFACVS